MDRQRTASQPRDYAEAAGTRAVLARNMIHQRMLLWAYRCVSLSPIALGKTEDGMETTCVISTIFEAVRAASICYRRIIFDVPLSGAWSTQNARII